MPSHPIDIEHSFNLKLEQLDDQDNENPPKVIGSIFITSNTIKKICRQERVLAWALPLAALQRKIGENGRFVLPDMSIIDNVFEFTVHDYLRHRIEASSSNEKSFPSVMVINWLTRNEPPKRAGESTGSGKAGVESEGQDPKQNSNGPMVEKDWDYVFQANKILNCSLVDPSTRQISRASHAAFRLKTSNEDDAEPDLPQDDERAKIPAWTLSKEPSRTYIHETHSELETSAMMSGHSKKSLEVGVSGAYKDLSAEGKYGRTTESAYKDTNAYGKKESTMLTIHEIPIVELSLDEGNSRISDACRQALLKLRDERNFSDLLEFFVKYGTMYAKKVVLGGRLVGSQRFFEESMEETKTRQQSARTNASLSLGIDPFSVKGSYADEHGTQTAHTKSETADQKNIDWTAIGGNAGYASNPEKWLPTVIEYRNWKIIKNVEVISIQTFIGRLPGYDDIPSLFEEILNGGLYRPESLHLGPRPALPGQTVPPDDGLDVAPLGVGVDMLNLGPASPRKSAMAESMLQYEDSQVKATGGTSWRVLDTADAVKSAILSTMQSITNTSAKRSTIPEYLYCLSLKPRTISVVLQWNSDLVEKGLNLGSPGATEVKKYTTLNILAPQQCSNVLTKASALKLVKKADDAAKEEVGGKDEFLQSLDSLAGCIQISSLAAFKVASWRNYFEARFLALETATAKESFLDSIKTTITSLPEEDIVQQSSTMVPFEVTSEALFKKDDSRDAVKYKQAFITNFGHKYLESYTEQASLNAVWHLHLPGGTPEDFYTLRMTLQKYFLGPRTVPEVCDFLSAPNNTYDDFQRLSNVEIKVSIFGYRDEFTREPKQLVDLSPAHAHHYLTPDALSRNTNRKTLTMRPWQGLHVKGVAPPDNHLAKDIPPVAPEEFFVLNTRKAERLLLLLKLYSQEPHSQDPHSQHPHSQHPHSQHPHSQHPHSGAKEESLSGFGKRLDVILEPSSLQRDTGIMTEPRKKSLIKLVRELEEALPESDLESTAGKTSDAVVDGKKNR